MTRPRPRLALLLLAAASACAGLTVGDDEGCPEACAAAYACGFLPSALGWAADAQAALVDCERRCGQSPRDTPAVERALACLQGTLEPPDDLLSWCVDPDDPGYATGLACAAAAACIDGALQGGEVIGVVSLDVSLIGFADFEAAFGPGSVEQLYVDHVGEVQSCAPALCGPADCTRRGQSEPACDPTLCRTAETQTVQACDELQVRVLDVLAEQRGGALASQELIDASEPTACQLATVSFAGGAAQLYPGPVRTSARFGGELPASQLARLHEPPGDPGDDDTPTRYCLQFIGMSVTLRSGENVALVPIGGIDDILTYRARPIACDR